MNDKCLFFYENECKFLFCSFIIFFFFFDSFILLSWAFVWNDAQAFQIDTLNCFCEVAVIRIVDDRNHNWNLIGTRFKLYYYYTVHCHSVIISKQRFPRPQLVDEALRCLDGSLLRMFFNDCLLCINVNKRIRWLIKKEFFFFKSKTSQLAQPAAGVEQSLAFCIFVFFFFCGGFILPGVISVKPSAFPLQFKFQECAQRPVGGVQLMRIQIHNWNLLFFSFRRPRPAKRKHWAPCWTAVFSRPLCIPFLLIEQI